MSLTYEGGYKHNSKGKRRDEDKPRKDIHKEVTDKIVAAIEAGAGEFQMPWHRPGISSILPRNALTDKKYNGINIIALWVAADEKNYPLPYWATLKQWNELGARIRKGERSSLIVKYGTWTPKEAREKAQSPEEEENATRSYASPALVFNAAQVDGWTAPGYERPDLTTALAQVDAFLAKAGVTIKEGGHRAFYCPRRDDGTGDFVQMPPRNLFTGTATSTPTEAYESTRLHEAGHWTGDKQRCDRQFGKRFGDEAYAVEELVAELTAAFLCAELGITNTPRLDHAQYVENWLHVLGSDKRAIFTAASAASKAVEYLVARQE